MSTLAELEYHAPRDYQSLVGSPISLLPLGEDATANIWPFSTFLFPTDKFELTHSRGAAVTFQLDRAVFETGTIANTAAMLREAEEKLFRTRKKYYKLTSSPLHSITLPDLAREAAYIPDRARFYSFCYPSVRGDGAAEFHTWTSGVAAKFVPLDPFIQFFLNGAYVYYDHQFDIVAINALVFEPSAGLREALTPNKGELVSPPSPSGSSPTPGPSDGLPTAFKSAQIMFGKPCALPRKAIEPLFEYGRWQEITFSSTHFFWRGITHFAWILPSEFIGDSIFTQSGGFAYLHSNDVILIADPVVGDTVRYTAEGLRYTSNGTVIERDGMRICVKPMSGDATWIAVADVELTTDPADGSVPKVKLTGQSVSRFFPVVPKQVLVKHAKEKIESLDGTSAPKPRMVHKYGELKSMCDSNLSDALEIVELMREEAKASALTPRPYDAPMHIEPLMAMPKSGEGEGDDKFVLNYEPGRAIFADGEKSAHGLSASLGFANDDEMRTKLKELYGVVGEDMTAREAHTAAKYVEAWQPKGHQSLDGKVADNEQVPPQTESPTAKLGSMGDMELLRGEYKKLTEQDIQLLHEQNACYLQKNESVKQYLDKVLKVVDYILNEPAKEEEVDSNDGHGKVTRDAGHANWTLAKFCKHPNAISAKLSLAHCAALRIYTSLIFRLINGPLRKPESVFKLTDQCHPLAFTTWLASDALKKLRANHMTGDKFRSKYLWRGLKNMEVTDDFLLKGGTELACMSTSTDLDVICQYARSHVPLIFRLRVDSPMEMGADLSWISLFPHEKEICYPPLTFIKPMFTQRIKDDNEDEATRIKGMVVTLKPSFPS